MVVAWLNIELKITLVGWLTFLIYLIPLTIFTGRVLFKEENVTFRLTFGFIALLAIVAFFGSMTYLVVNYSWPLMLSLLVAIALSLSLLCERIEKQKKSITENEIKTRVSIQDWKKYARDFIFISFILLSLLEIYVGRTDESIHTFWQVIDPTIFFLLYSGALSIMVLEILSGKGTTGRVLSYVVLLTLVVALLPIISVEYPQTHMMGSNIAWTRHLTEFGRFISEPNQIERASSPIHKHLEFTGYHVIMTTLSRLLSCDPALFNILLTPILFSFYAPLIAYKIVKTAFPKKHNVALMSALALLISQHNIYLLIPPGKPETLGLLFLLLLMFFWTKYLIRKEKDDFSSIFIRMLFAMATVLSHPNVGVLAVSLFVVSIYLRVTRPFEASDRGKIKNSSYIFGYIVLIAILSFTLIISYYLSANALAVGRTYVLKPNIDVIEWIKVLFPPLKPLQIYSLLGLRDMYLNNFTYIWYALIFGGILLSRRWRVNHNFLLLIIPLIFLSFTNMIIQQFFFTGFWDREWYRYFYYLNFITYPFAGISLYAITRVLVAINPVRIIVRTPSWKLNILITAAPLIVLLLVGMITGAVYGGFPRVGSLGPYTAGAPMFVSKYDMFAMELISERESQYNRTFFIVGDPNTAGAVLLTFGHEVHLIDGKYYTFASYATAEGRKVWAEALKNPSPQVLDEALHVLKADALYFVFTNRLGNLQDVVESYLHSLLEPIVYKPEKIYVFEYTSETLNRINPIEIVDDNQSARVDLYPMFNNYTHKFLRKPIFKIRETSISNNTYQSKP